MNIDKIGLVLGIIVIAFFGVMTYGNSQDDAIVYTPPQEHHEDDDHTHDDDHSHDSVVSHDEHMQVLTLADVETHATEDSCYTVIDEKVYDLTEWIARHPGGARAILSICGTDGTAAFARQHGASEHAAEALTSYYIGDLAQ